MPSTLRPPETTSTDAAADAVTEGCRVTRLVTHVASGMCEVTEAAKVMATHGSMALPGVSAMPTMSKPWSSPRRAMRSVYSGVYGQKKNPTRMRPRSGLGGRIVARVGGTLEKLLGLVGPELRDGRVRMDHGVHELAAGLLHPDDVDVLGGIAVLVELDGTARVRHRLDGVANGRHELLPVFHLAVQRLRGVGDPATRAVHDGGEIGGGPPHLGRGELHEDLVRWILQGRAPEQRAHDAHGLVAHAAERALVRHHPGADEGRLGLEPRLAVLLDEAHGLSRHEHRADRVHVLLDLREIRGEVERVERDPELLHDLASAILEHALEPADLLVAEGVVHGNGGHSPVLEGLGRVVAQRMHDLARREVGAQDPLGDLALGQLVGRREEEGGQLIALDEGHEALPHVREKDAGEDVDLVVVDELAILRDGGGRAALGVLLDELDLAAARLVVDLLERQLETIEHVLAGLGEDAGERTEVADANRLRGPGGAGTEQGESQHHACDAGAAALPHTNASLE